MTPHVVLVGLMGSGKTTVGRRLAARLGRDFIDADDALAEITDRTIAEIFATDGEDAFRAIEADVLEELLEHHQPTVIASGGGVVLATEQPASSARTGGHGRVARRRAGVPRQSGRAARAPAPPCR